MVLLYYQSKIFSILFLYYFCVLLSEEISYFWRDSKNLFLILNARSERHSLRSIQTDMVCLDAENSRQIWHVKLSRANLQEWMKIYYMTQLQEPTWFPSQRTCHQRQLWNIYYCVQKYCAGFSYGIYWKPGKIIIIFFLGRRTMLNAELSFLYPQSLQFPHTNILEKRKKLLPLRNWKPESQLLIYVKLLWCR